MKEIYLVTWRNLISPFNSFSAGAAGCHECHSGSRVGTAPCSRVPWWHLDDPNLRPELEIRLPLAFQVTILTRTSNDKRNNPVNRRVFAEEGWQRIELFRKVLQYSVQNVGTVNLDDGEDTDLRYNDEDVEVGNEKRLCLPDLLLHSW